MTKYFFLLIAICACNSNSGENAKRMASIQRNKAPMLPALLEDTVAGVAVTIIQDFEDTAKGVSNLLVLPGWDFSRYRWLNETKLRELSRKHKYRLFLPEMGRCIYASHFYSETSVAARKEKTGIWLTDTFLSAMQQKYQAFGTSQHNFVLGLSTGGRGAIYCAWKKPDIFKGAAALSGDFDQTLAPSDFLVTEVYGPFQKYSQRWKNEDNLCYVASEIKPPLYLSHGDADKVVPVAQTRRFYEKIQPTNSAVTLNIAKGSAHDFVFWGSEIAPVFDFFDQQK